MMFQKKQLHQNEPTGTEVAFAQGVDIGFGNRIGNYHRCGKKGNHVFECPDKDKYINLDSKKKDKDDVKDPPSNSGGGKNETINTTHGTETGGGWDSDAEFDNFQFRFATVGDVLNVTGLEKMVKESKIPIKRSWVLLDSQSTVSCFRNEDELTNLCQVEESVMMMVEFVKQTGRVIMMDYKK